ncbi:MAG: hypothetical protein ACRDGH_17890, partial [Candidatus Limnocylindria bacterium]
MRALKPLEGLACFGSSSMTLQVYATANPQGGGCAPGDPVAPTWLAPCAAVSLEEAESLYPAGDTLWIQIAPTLGSCNGQGFGPNCPLAALHGRWIRITVHLDYPQAQSCAVGPHSIGTPDQDATILQCRAALVASAITADDGLGELDQHQENWLPESPMGYQPHSSSSATWSRAAQTFTPGRTGELTAIQLPLNRLVGTSGPLVVQIRKGNGEGELLATSPSLNWADLPSDSLSCAPPQCVALDRAFAWVTIR